MTLGCFARWIFAVGAILMAVSLAQATCRAETITNGLGMKLVLIPAGEFMMGNEEGVAETLKYFPYCLPHVLDGEVPRHKVRITKPFYMGQYTVTLGQFLKFYHTAHYKLDIEYDKKPSWGFSDGKLIQSVKFRPWAPGWKIGMNHPAVYVSWNDAVAFCDWLSKREGKTYRLPTEAEWEYACRAGTNSRYYFGNDPGDLVKYARANLSSGASTIVFDEHDNKKDIPSSVPGQRQQRGYTFTAPVGQFRPNAFGLYDMHGNVWQWCSDWFGRRYYENSPVDDPKGPDYARCRVMRGGGFNYVAGNLRCATRTGLDPSIRRCEVGFRVVREP
jgi:formylglycine-generating enzyme required for sulfatase activity